MRRKSNYEKVEFHDGLWHEVKNPNESTQHMLAFLYEDNDNYTIESYVWYYICDDGSIPEKYKYWTTNMITLKDPNTNPFRERGNYIFEERFITYSDAKNFVFKWNNDARLFVQTIHTNPDENLLTKYYKVQRENKDLDYENILELLT